jgi:prefoldin subunit 5
MIVIDSDTNNGACTSPKKDTEQDIQIESLQTAIDTINSQITAINQTLAALSDSIDDKYSAQTQTLMSELNSRLAGLTQSLAQSFSTEQVNAIIGNFERLAAVLSAEIGNLAVRIISVTEKITAVAVDAESADIGNIDSNNIDTDTLTAQSAQINSLVVDLLNMTSLSVTNLTAGTLAADRAEIREIESDVVKADVMSGKDWKTPISTPDNTELLKITLPKYDGVLHLTSQDDEISVTVFNNSIVTYNETEEYLYRIERDENENTCVYLANVGDTINYRVLHVGSETFENDYSEIVDKTLFEQNITEKEGALFFYLSDFVDSKDLLFLKGAEDNIQNQINSKQDKTLATPVLINGQRYDSVETAIQQMAAILNGLLVNDIIYNELTEELIFPYNSIAYDSSDEELTVSGFNQVYDSENAELTFSR